jgi:hypothetical protein
MRIELMDGELTTRQVGAAVVRSNRADLVVEFGPADGPPLTKLHLSPSEAKRLISALRAVIDGGGESVILVEE